MIQKQRKLFFFVGDVPFNTLEEAQRADIERLMPVTMGDAHSPGATRKDILDWVMTNAAALVDTLTTTPNSRAKARKSNGATRKRKRPLIQPAELKEA